MQEMQETQVQSLGWEDLLEKKMTTNSSILAWKISWREEPGRLQSMEGHKESGITERKHTHTRTHTHARAHTHTHTHTLTKFSIVFKIMPGILQSIEEIYKSFESMKWTNVLNISNN